MSATFRPFPTTHDKAKQNKKDQTTDWSSPHHYADRHKRFPAQETLIGSYLHQLYKINNLDLTPTRKRTKNHNLNGVILTAWNQFGKPTDEDENVKNNEKLKEFFEKHNIEYEPILTLASNYRWLEDAYLVKNINQERAEDIATAFGQLAYITLEANKAILRLTTNASFMGLPRETEHETFIKVTTETYNHCPARFPAKDDSVCRQVGGPFGSAAIHAAGIWSTTRSQFVRRLGCTPCNKGKAPVNGPGGSAILLQEPCMPSRFGGFQWESEPYMGN